MIGRAKREGPDGYIPALDGLRAVAVGIVLCFHQGYPWASGGYLGVSLFFTLSGFLIASLLLHEHSSTGRVALGSFWARRGRRILPTAAIGVAGVWIALNWVDFGSVVSVRRDALASLAYVMNWRLLLGNQSYGDLFSAPSPLIHYWSLAIEEQFYLVIAPLFVVMLRWHRNALAAVCGLLFVAGATISLRAGHHHETDAVYYSTFSRLPELMIGVLAAIVVHRSPRGGVTWRPARPLMLNLASLIAAAALAVAVVELVPNDSFLDHGGLLLIALASVTLVLAATSGGTWLAGLLRFGPLPAVGRLSYALYVVHWPIFLILTAERTGYHGNALFGLRMAASVAAAVLITQLLEVPVRRYLRTPRAIGLVAVPLTSLLALVVLLGPAPPTSSTAAASDFKPIVLSSFQPPASMPPSALAVGMFGDSTALRTAWGLGWWGSDHHLLNFVGGSARVACGLGRGGDHRYQGRVGAEPADCDWSTSWKAELDAHPDMRVAIIQVGPWDVADRRLPGDTKWRRPGDPIYDQYLLGEMNGVLDMFAQYHVEVVWLTSPEIASARAVVPPPAKPYPESDPARMHRFNQLVMEATAGRADAHVVDLAGHLAALPGGELDPALRPDGVHFTQVTARQVADWLGPAVLAAVSGPEG